MASKETPSNDTSPASKTTQTPLDVIPQESSSNLQETPALNEVQKSDAVAELLGLSTPDEPAEKVAKTPATPETMDDLLGEPLPNQVTVDPEPNSKPTNFSEAAEKLGMSTKDLYKLTLTTGDGEEVSLGDMKDAFQTTKATEHESAQRSIALDERETALIADQRLWAELGDQLATVVPPELLGKLSANLQQRDQDERRRMVRAMPEMADPAQFDQFRNDAAELLSTHYGYSAHELVIGDHRQLLVVRDLIRARKRLKQLADFKPQAKVPKPVKSTGRVKRPSKGQQLISRGKAGGETDKVNAIASLIGG